MKSRPINKFIYLFILLLLNSGSPLLASDLYMRPAGSSNGDMFFSDLTSSSPNTASGLQVNTTISCYPTNLRSVSNPLSPTSSVKLEAEFYTGDKFSVVFPGWLALENRQTSTVVSPLVTYFNGARNAFPAQGVSNNIIFNIPGLNFSIAGSNGQYNAGQRDQLIRTIFFVQDMTSCWGMSASPTALQDWPIQKALKNLMRPLRSFSEASNTSYAGGDGDGDGDGGGDGGGDGDGGDGGGHDQFVKLNQPQPMTNDTGWFQPCWTSPPTILRPNGPGNPANFQGKDGPLAGHWQATWSSDFHTLNISAAFPGQVYFCGGFFSPLMLFFNDSRPHYTANVKFRMNSYSDRTYWPESNSEGYFLALDRNGDGIINDISELFGSEDDSSNGFEVLKYFDSNNDGVIDEKDPIFKHLVLWHDSTGTGVTLKKDLKTLKEMGIIEIRLNYSTPYVRSEGQRAEERERAEFTFVKSGKIQKGEVIDVWFGSN